MDYMSWHAYLVFVPFKICHMLLLYLWIQWIHCFTQGLFGRKNCSKQAQALRCSVCNGRHALKFRSFILAKYVTCVGYLDAYSEMIYCSRCGRFSHVTYVLNLYARWNQTCYTKINIMVFHASCMCWMFFGLHVNINKPENIMCCTCIVYWCETFPCYP
jgi:hypothetical protein